MKNGFKMFRTCLIAGLILALGINVPNAETVYPTGSSITASYQLSDTLINLSDTLTISRTVTNNESFDLTGLYFSENLPPECNLIEYTVTIDGTPITPEFTDGLADMVVPGCLSYWWTIDQPTGPYDTIRAGETVDLTVRLTFDSVGTYSLPFHTAVFSGGATSFFVTADSEIVRTYIPTDVEDEEDDERNLPAQFEFSQAYPNPFNGSAKIQYSGSVLAGHKALLTIRNLLGQKIHEREFLIRSDRGAIEWEPSDKLSSGVYFYSLTIDSPATKASKGKLMLLK